MPTLTPQELAALEAIKNVSLENFTVQDAIDYYTYLQGKGFDYATLALGVVQDDTGRGAIANAYANRVAAEHDVDFSVGSAAWKEMQWNLMQQDWTRRNAAGGDELTWEAYGAAHDAAFAEVGLPPEAWSPTVPLNQMAETNPTLAAAVWDDLITNTGFFDGWFTEGLFTIGFNDNIPRDQPLADIAADYGAQAKWYANMMLALWDAGDEIVDEVLPDETFTQFWADFEEAKEFLDGLFGEDPVRPGGWLDGLDNPTGNYLRPDWLGDALTPFNAAPPPSPLVLDLDGDGVELTTFNAATTTTFFDIDGDGFAEQTAWVSNDDGFLARDINENGTIDDVTELFGSPNIDGFALLAQLDTNGDLLISSFDDAWDELVVWQDADDDAVTDAGELISLATLNIVSIDLAGVVPSSSTISGNPISHTSTFKYANGSTDDIVDAWFVLDQANSFYSQDYDLDLRTLFLPTLRGFGEVADLHIAMSQNEELLDMVVAFADGFGLEDFADEAALDDALSDILYEWAGVQDETPINYNNILDSRQKEFVEAFFGREYPVSEMWVERSKNIKASWDIVFGNVKAQLLVQVGAAPLFDGDVTYDVWAGEITGDTTLSQTAIDGLVAFATAGGVDTEAYWVAVARFLQFAKGGFEEFSVTEEGWLDDAIYDSDPLLTWEGIVALVGDGIGAGSTFDGTSGNDTLTGTTGHDTINGYDGNDTLNGGDGADTINGHAGDDTINGGEHADVLYGSYGNDTINGDGGSDTIQGNDGNDIINPGTGGNNVQGGIGDDLYYHGGGDDYYIDTSGADEIRLAAGIDAGDITLAGVGASSDLVITIEGQGTIQVYNQFYVYSSSFRIETLRFYDNSTLSLTSFSALDIQGTEGNDTIYWAYGSSATDYTIYGYAGADSINADHGDDTIDGGEGNDTINGKNGDDAYIASAGFDTIAEEGYTSTGDIIFIPAAYDADDITLYRDGTVYNNYDLTILIAGLGQIKIDEQFWFANSGIEDIVFENSDPSIDLQAIGIESIGTNGNDTVYGILSNSSGDDILDGRAGNDTLSGFSGDDTYAASAGNDVINESGNNENDRILFRDDNGLEDLTIYRGKDSQGPYFDSLFIEHLYGTIEVRNQFLYTSGAFWYSVKEIELPGSVTIDLFNTPIETRGTSSADSIQGVTAAPFLDDIIYGYAGNDTLQGHSGNDYLDGGAGSDSLDGGAGDDVFAYSEGLDTANDSSGGTDTLRLLGSVTINDISFSNVSSYHTKLTVTASTDEITINWLRHWDTSSHIERISFADGFETSLPDYASWVTGTGSGETLNGTSGDDTLVAKAGNDTVNAGSGHDDAHGGTGDDTLNGEGGNDVLFGGDDNDTISGGAGNDTINGGNGTDTLTYSAAAAGVTVNLGSGTASNDGDSGSDTISNIENVTGSANNDNITGNTGANTLIGAAGADTLDGGDGDDTLRGGAGTDTLTGGNGTDTADYSAAAGAVTVNLGSGTASNDGDSASDTLSGIENVTGSANNDTITGSSGANVLNGANGTDTIVGGAGNDTIDGGGGTDTLSYSAAAAAVTVNLGSATASNDGDGGSDTISNVENVTGSAFNDTITGDANANNIDGGAGDDVIEGGAGNDTLNGGSNTDRLTYANAGSAITINLATATAQNTGGAGTDTISNFENLTGSAYNDTLTGNGSANIIEGGAGNDTINSAGGTDTVSYANAGSAVTVNLATTTGQNTGGAGTDTITNTENLTGSAYNDTLTGNGSANVIEGGAGDDTINGAGGTDTVTYANAAAAVVVNLATTTGQNTGGAGTDTITNTESLTGSAYNDTLTGNSSANTINGGDGNDVIEGGAGNDTLNGGNGTDTLTYINAGSAITMNLATGSGQVTGGAGTDTVSNFENLTGSAFNDTLTGNGNDNVIEGGAGNDTINGAGGTDTVTYVSVGSAVTVNLSTGTGQNTGGAGTDTLSNLENLTGSSYNDTLTGNTSANVLEGGAGNDTINGGVGGDTLYGNDGDDLLYGADGLDNLNGGAGADDFIFEAASAFNNVDVIMDFVANDNDAIDINDVIAFDPGTDVITDFVQITTNGSNSEIRVDVTGSANFGGGTLIATIQGVTGLTDEAALVTSGHLLVA